MNKRQENAGDLAVFLNVFVLMQMCLCTKNIDKEAFCYIHGHDLDDIK